MYSYLSGDLKKEEFFIIFFGGLVMSITGFIDDMINIRPIIRLFIQILIVFWGLYWIDGLSFIEESFSFKFFINMFSVVTLVWFINAFNFMDGIDGMSSSGAIFFSITIGGYLLWQGVEPLGNLLLILAFSSLAFLSFNWPPAKIFLGDAGSYFYGYLFPFVFLITTKNGDVSIWTWLIIFSYFIIDTIVTITLRLFLVKNWYQTHHSHAYQNLARIKKSHRYVTTLVIIINIFYLLPLSLSSILYPEFGWILFCIGISPILVFVLRFGPLYEK